MVFLELLCLLHLCLHLNRCCMFVVVVPLPLHLHTFPTRFCLVLVRTPINGPSTSACFFCGLLFSFFAFSFLVSCCLLLVFVFFFFSLWSCFNTVWFFPRGPPRFFFPPFPTVLSQPRHLTAVPRRNRTSSLVLPRLFNQSLFSLLLSPFLPLL